MATFAAVTTGQGIGAIATVELFGERAEAVLREIFKPASGKKGTFETGKILLGEIVDAGRTIDQVTVGCEGPEHFAIHCHGNPLLVSDVMALLEQKGLTLTTAESLIARTAAAGGRNAIEIEADLAIPKAKTLKGAKIIRNQLNRGLVRWLENARNLSPDRLKNEAEQILKDSITAKIIIAGAKVAIVGPANSGKSALLNCLAGKQKAIVTEVKGTTRDWISAQCGLGELSVEFFDTAGLDREPAPSDIEGESQKRSLQILGQADLVLLVLDRSRPARQLTGRMVKRLRGKPAITVLNKSDLPAVLDLSELPAVLTEPVQISAKTGTGIEKLVERIRRLLGEAGFNPHRPVCFTERQELLVRRLCEVKSTNQTAAIIAELLNGEVVV